MKYNTIKSRLKPPHAYKHSHTNGSCLSLVVWLQLVGRVRDVYTRCKQRQPADEPVHHVYTHRCFSCLYCMRFSFCGHGGAGGGGVSLFGEFAPYAQYPCRHLWLRCVNVKHISFHSACSWQPHVGGTHSCLCLSVHFPWMFWCGLLSCQCFKQGHCS